MRRRHLPVPEQGRWLASVVRGHLAYYAVPGNGKAVNSFWYVAIRHWHRALRRRSQRSSLTLRRVASPNDGSRQSGSRTPGLTRDSTLVSKPRAQ
jgi:hypothetical protein